MADSHPLAAPFRHHPSERDPRRWPPILAAVLVRPQSARAVYRALRDPDADRRVQKIAVSAALTTMAAEGLVERHTEGWLATSAGRLAYPAMLDVDEGGAA